MEFHKVSSFIESLPLLEEFISELAAREDEIALRGLKRTRIWESYEKAYEVIDNFEQSLYELIRHSSAVDSKLSEQINEIVDSSNLATSIAQVSVSINIAERKGKTNRISIIEPFSMSLQILASILGIGIKSKNGISFGNDEISLSKILVALKRLIPLSQAVVSRYYAYHYDDDEVFKPSNINIENITVYVDNSINAIKENHIIDTKTKNKLLECLGEIKVELAKEPPVWQKVVGTFVIISTIMGGIAVAPQAIENVNKAVMEILGTSIEKNIPWELSPNDDKPKLMLT